MTETAATVTVAIKSPLQASRFQDPLLTTVPRIGPIAIYV